MRVPIRKPGKYTHDKVDTNITEKRYHYLIAKLERLIKQVRPPMIKEVKRLALMGDFSENVAYSIAKGRLRGLNQGIIEMQDLINKAKIIKPNNTGKVELGNFVTIEINGKKKKYQILGSTETNPDLGIISHNSPIGAALMSHRVGDVVEVKGKEKVNLYKVLKIE